MSWASKNAVMKVQSAGFALTVHDARTDLGPHGFFELRWGMQVCYCPVVETALLQIRRARIAAALDSTAGSYPFMVSIHPLLHLLTCACYLPAADYQRGRRKVATIELEWALRQVHHRRLPNARSIGNRRIFLLRWRCTRIMAPGRS